MKYIRTQTNQKTNSKCIEGVSIQQAYVLAGGQSRRMGRDKLFVTVDGQPLLSHTLSVCQSTIGSVSIVAKSADKFAELSTPVIIDYPNAFGPLGGIIAALSDCQGNACFVLAADLADIDKDTINFLCENYKGEDYLGLRESGGVQPLCGIYSKKTLNVLLTIANENKPYQMWRILENLNTRYLPINKSVWRNINHPEDVHSISKRTSPRMDAAS